MVDKAKRVVVSKLHLSNYREAELPKMIKFATVLKTVAKVSKFSMTFQLNLSLYSIYSIVCPSALLTASNCKIH